LAFVGGVFTGRSKYLSSVIMPSVRANYKIPINYFKGLLAAPEQITIDIKHKDYQKLAYLRDLALKAGKIITDDDSYVPAKIRVGDRIVKVDIRLKGDITDHIEDKRWSLRVKVKGNDAIFGMTRFSLQDPKVCGYINEWLLHQLYRYEGLISLRFKFVDVIINGKNMGIYALEESFSKELIEHNNRREGPILKFNEKYLWDGTYGNKGTVKSQADIFFASDIDVFRTKKTYADKNLLLNYGVASLMLDNFRAGLAQPSQVFDIDRLAKLYALANLTNSDHVLRWKNVRYYYNPILNKLEAIGYNSYSSGMRIGQRREMIFSNSYPQGYFVTEYHNMLFEDDDFLTKYMQALEKFSDQAYLDAFFLSIEDELQMNLSILYRNYPFYDFNKTDFYNNQRLIRGMLNPAIAAKARAIKNNQVNAPKFQVANTGFLPIVPVAIQSSSGDSSFPLRTAVLPGKAQSRPLKYHEVYFADPAEQKATSLLRGRFLFIYRIVGLDELHSSPLEILSLDESGLTLLDHQKALKDLAADRIFEVDAAKREVRVRPGSWQLSKDIVVPKGFRVVCPAGVKLDLTNSAKLVSHSPLTFTGTKNAPIIFNSSDSSGQGLVVLSADGKSILKHVYFRNLTNPSCDAWNLTGAITFYESPVGFFNCEFVKNNAEDSLNIVRTNFLVDSCYFGRAASDAIDVDFGDGEILSTNFANSSNDAIDVSGGRVSVQDVFIDGAGDKGLSAGEGCRLVAKDVKLKNVEIAVASKDRSSLSLYDAVITDAQVGLTVFQKKPEFDAAAIVAHGVELSGVKVPFLVEKGSSILVDGKEIEASRENVKEILYGVQYGKSSQ
jgi:hypothetical protein